MSFVIRAVNSLQFCYIYVSFPLINHITKIDIQWYINVYIVHGNFTKQKYK